MTAAKTDTKTHTKTDTRTDTATHTPAKARPPSTDAKALLKADHEGVSQLFDEYGKHHVKEEQTEMFPKAKASTLDMAELGAQLAARKADLLAAAAGTGSPTP
jgi:hypothetical protein